VERTAFSRPAYTLDDLFAQREKVNWSRHRL
jgi:hypothetical protein